MSFCNICGGSKLVPLIDFGKHPIAHHFVNDPKQEEYSHSVQLCSCPSCGLIQLADPIPAEKLYSDYFCLTSWKYQPHIPALIKLLEGLPGFTKATKIFEAGCNDGIFLSALTERGYKNFLGIEPAQDAYRSALGRGLKVVPGYFNPENAKKIVRDHGKFDLFIVRQVLEHIKDLGSFSDSIRAVISPGSYVLIEVPDFNFFLKAPDYTVWEEHVNYFTLDTLKYFMAKSGIKFVHGESVTFGSESLIVIGQYTGEGMPDVTTDYLDGLNKAAARYRDLWPEFRKKITAYLSKHKDSGGKTAIYGAGARLCSLVNFCGIGRYIDIIVDDQPEKQGKYLPGSKLAILPSSALEKYSIDLCLLAVNTECEDSAIAKHQAYLKRGGRFVSVLPPSSRLPDFWRDLEKNAISGVRPCE